MNDKYQSVSCELHSQYELLAMHHSRISLSAVDDKGQQQDIDCQVIDIKTTGGAEYLVVSKDNQLIEFRLDNIKSLSPLQTR